METTAMIPGRMPKDCVSLLETILINLDWTTPISFHSIKKVINNNSQAGKQKNHDFSDGDICIFSWHQWHPTGLPVTDTNIQIHLMLSSTMENDMAKEWDFLEIHPSLENENLCSNEFQSKYLA